MIAAVLVLNVRANPVVELRQYQLPGMLLAHGGMLAVAVGAWPMLSRGWRATAVIEPSRLAMGSAAAVLGLAGFMVLLLVGWPDYAHQLLTREWGVVEPLQFVLYLLTARLCFGAVRHQVARTSWRRLFVVNGWCAVLLALEEIDYLGVLSLLVRLGGLEGARVGRAYVGGLHDLVNVAAEYGFAWLAVLAVAAAFVPAAWWISGGQWRTVRNMLSWRIIPAMVGLAFMAIAQLKDIHGRYVRNWFDSRLLNDFLEEPLELLGILCLNLTFLLVLAQSQERDRDAGLDTTSAAGMPD